MDLGKHICTHMGSWVVTREYNSQPCGRAPFTQGTYLLSVCTCDCCRHRLRCNQCYRGRWTATSSPCLCWMSHLLMPTSMLLFTHFFPWWTTHCSFVLGSATHPLPYLIAINPPIHLTWRLLLLSYQQHQAHIQAHSIYLLHPWLPFTCSHSPTLIVQPTCLLIATNVVSCPSHAYHIGSFCPLMVFATSPTEGFLRNIIGKTCAAFAVYWPRAERCWWGIHG
jgi:hypothetical protein